MSTGTEPSRAGASGWTTRAAQRVTAPRIFWPAAGLVLAFVLVTVIWPGRVEDLLQSAMDNVVGAFGWYYVLIVAAFVIFAIWMGLSRFGDIRLGKEDDEPEFGVRTWFAMLFAAGMGIGLVFWGVAEPLSHYANPKPGTDGSDIGLAQTALAQTYLHWGIHAWAIYVVVGLALAYAIHRRGRPVSIRWALEPILGDRVKGTAGDVIDIVAIIGTVFGVATSLGLGVLQIAAGFERIGWADTSTALQVILIVAITLLAVLSVATGLDKGIKWLSNVNLVIAGLVMLFVLVAGPTLFLLREFVQSIGVYLINVLPMTFDNSAYTGAEGQEWQSAWTTFYWGWWMSWAPFVGVFIARISKGRTVREFVAGVLLVPTIVTFLWFAVLGGSGLYREIFGEGGLVQPDRTVNEDFAMFDLLDGLPAGGIVSVLVIFLIVVFFVTSSDSGSLVVDMLASGGDPDPPVWSRVFWASVEGLVAVALLVAGGLLALRTMAIMIALPFSLVMLGICVATVRAFHGEHQAFVRAQARQLRSELTEHVTEHVTGRFEGRFEDVEHSVDRALAEDGGSTDEPEQTGSTSPRAVKAERSKPKRRLPPFRSR
ncbi:MAG TPA: BCCT family transporter [Jiangellaceae bacterium]